MSSAACDLLAEIDLLVFDKDGTLIEFHLMWGNWVEELARRLERASGLELRERLYPLLGVDRSTGLVHAHGLLAATPMSRIRDVVQADVAEAGATQDVAAAAVAAAWHAPDPVALAHPVTDLPALLDTLGDRVGTFAVATSDDRDPTERTLAALGISDRFAQLVCADDGIRTKPSPDPVLHLCEQLGIPPDRTAVVGDSPADLLMGRQAGARRSIAVLTGVGDRASLEPYADAVVASIAELA
ncbi:MAG TPA: HAD family hydrolase [Candidatus Limnocylindrales bacterium]|nr:HAD family hydrolase [Candidatus Limnocylindrales bacterium]